MEKEKLSAILSKGRNGTKGWFLYRAWPSTRSAIYVYLMSMLAALPVGIAAAFSCELYIALQPAYKLPGSMHY